MIRSMTGYGDAECSHDELSYTLEIRSVNNRYFKLTTKLPDSMQFFDTEVEKLLRVRLNRGSINYQLKIKSGDAGAGTQINIEALRAYAAQLQVFVQEGLVDKIDLASLLSLPGVTGGCEIDAQAREQMARVVMELTEQAIEKLIAMRQEEGLALGEDLLKQAAEIRCLAGETAERAPQVVAAYQAKLKTRVDQLLADVKLEVEQDDLLREVAVFADRCDICEELTRLTSHLDQFEQLCHGNDNVGRKLDFLAQEMLREVNTLGSKANDATIARNVVNMKSLIDRIKEQVQNVE